MMQPVGQIVLTMRNGALCDTRSANPTFAAARQSSLVAGASFEGQPASRDAPSAPREYPHSPDVKAAPPGQAGHGVHW